MPAVYEIGTSILAKLSTGHGRQPHPAALTWRKSDFSQQADQLNTSPDLTLLPRYPAINVAAISTENLSALVNQKPRSRISSQADLTGFGRFGGGSGSAVVTSGSYCRALRRPGRFLNPPRNSSKTVGILGLYVQRVSVTTATPRSKMIGSYIRPEGKGLKRSRSWHGVWPLVYPLRTTRCCVE